MRRAPKQQEPDPAVARRILETAAVLRNFDLESMAVYLPYPSDAILVVLHQNEEFFDRRPTTSRKDATRQETSASGRWLVRDQAALLLHAIGLAEEADRGSLLSAKGSDIVIDARGTKAAQRPTP